MTAMTDRPASATAAGPAHPGSAASRPGGIDVWERWLPAWHVFNFAVLGLTSAIAFSEAEPEGPARAVVVAVVAVLAVAYWAAWVHRSIWDQAPWVRFAYAVLLLSGFAILLLLSPPFVFLQFSLYAQVFFCLPQRWAIVGGLSIGGDPGR